MEASMPQIDYYLYTTPPPTSAGGRAYSDGIDTDKKYADQADPKFDPKTYTTVRNLHIREDRPKTWIPTPLSMIPRHNP